MNPYINTMYSEKKDNTCCLNSIDRSINILCLSVTENMSKQITVTIVAAVEFSYILTFKNKGSYIQAIYKFT